MPEQQEETLISVTVRMAAPRGSVFGGDVGEAMVGQVTTFRVPGTAVYLRGVIAIAEVVDGGEAVEVTYLLDAGVADAAEVARFLHPAGALKGLAVVPDSA